MKKNGAIKRAIEIIAKLPDSKVTEVVDFANYLLKKYEEDVLTKGITKLVSKTKTYKFLDTEEDLYTVNDLKEKYK